MIPPLRFILAMLPVVIVITAVIIQFGPDPVSVTNRHDLWPDVAARAVSEPSDRLLFVFWTLAGVVVSLVAVRASSRPCQSSPDTRCWAPRLGLLLVWLLAISALLVSPSNANDDWRGLNLWTIGGSAALTVLVALAYISRGLPRLVANLCAGLLGLLYLFAAGWQTNQSLRDAYHFSIVLDDVIRTGSGRLPYIDFLPTYASLLGTPLAIIPQLDSINLVRQATTWLLVLQALSVLVVLTVVLIPARKSAYGVIILATIGPIAFVQQGSGQSALQASPVIPGRVLLPLLGLLLLVLAVCMRAKRRRTLSPLVSALLGTVFGLALLNNIEFGGAAAVAALVVILLFRSALLATVKRVSAFLVGVFVPLLAYATFGFVFESRNVARAILLIPLTYASAGFDLQPIESLGPFLLVVMLALSALVMGIHRLRSSHPGDRSSVSGVILTFAGVWAVVSMLYFSGRSFTSVLIAGQAVQVALILGSLTASLPAATRAVRVFGASIERLFGLALTLLPLFVSMSLVVSGGRPQAILAYGLSGQPVSTSFPAVEEVLTAVRTSSEWRPGDDPRVGLIIGNSTMAALQYGVQDASSMLPGFLKGSRTLMEFQCQTMGSYRFLILDPVIHDKMMEMSVCRNVLAKGQPMNVSQSVSDLVVYTFPSLG